MQTQWSMLPAVLLAVLAIAAAGDNSSESTASGIPVFVMLPLDAVANDGSVQSADQLRQSLQVLKDSNATGVMLDIWWGIVESAAPRQYNWRPYLEIVSAVQALGLQMQAIMSFHRCGGNIGDACSISLPAWLGAEKNWGYQDSSGNVNPEYISLFYDRNIISGSSDDRTPLQMYEDFMSSFAETFAPYFLGNETSPPTIVTVEVGLGPCGELRYPSYPLSHWRFPGVGEFQCYDPAALASLNATARADGRAAWGSPPSDAGDYNCWPEETGFFSVAGPGTGEMNYESGYGTYFLTWYSKALLQHARSILSAAHRAFNSSGVHVDAKVAGIHWQYKHASHAAELTAGYYNLGPRSGQDAYMAIAEVLRDTGAGLCFTALEMRNVEQPRCDCSPQELVSQTKAAALAAGVKYSGENALTRFDHQAYRTTEINARLRMNLNAFTYLRLGPQLLEERNFMAFQHFVQSMSRPQEALPAPVKDEAPPSRWAARGTDWTFYTESEFKNDNNSSQPPPPVRRALDMSYGSRFLHRSGSVGSEKTELQIAFFSIACFGAVFSYFAATSLKRPSPYIVL